VKDESHLLISNIYACATNPMGWGQVLESLAKITGSKSAAFLSPSNGADAFSIADGFNLDPSFQQLYQNHYYQYDPTLAVMLKSKNEPVIDHVTKNGMQLDRENSEVFYNEVMLPQGFHSTIAFGVNLPNEVKQTFVLMRGKTQDQYASKDIAFLQNIQSHVINSLNISCKFWEAKLLNKISVDFLEQTEVSVILLNPRGEICFISDSAEDEINQINFLGLAKNKIHALDCKQDADLQRLIKSAGSLSGNVALDGGGSLTLGDSTHSLQLAITPSNAITQELSAYGEPGYVAIVLSSYHAKPALLGDPLMALFDLTEMEADVMSKIVNGMSVQEIAAKKHRSVDTIRSQLKSIMKKTNTKRQVDLVRIATTSVARFL